MLSESDDDNEDNTNLSHSNTRCSPSVCWDNFLSAALAWSSTSTAATKTKPTNTGTGSKETTVDVTEKDTVNPAVLREREKIAELEMELDRRAWKESTTTVADWLLWLCKVGLSVAGRVVSFSLMVGKVWSAHIAPMIRQILAWEWRTVSTVFNWLTEGTSVLWSDVFLPLYDTYFATLVDRLVATVSVWYQGHLKEWVDANIISRIAFVYSAFMQIYAHFTKLYYGLGFNSVISWQKCNDAVDWMTAEVVSGAPEFANLIGGQTNVTNLLHVTIFTVIITWLYLLRRVIAGVLAAALALFLSPLLLLVWILAKIVGYILPSRKVAKKKSTTRKVVKIVKSSSQGSSFEDRKMPSMQHQRIHTTEQQQYQKSETRPQFGVSRMGSEDHNDFA